jgi:dTDP-4-dehydrorhamnose reductase
MMFAVHVSWQYGLKTTVLPVTAEEQEMNEAARPFNSRQDSTKRVKSGFQPLPD